MKSEMCSSCAHTKVCFKDKNICGDVFVPGNPLLFDNQELFKEYEKRKAAGFPCDDYMAAPISKPATNSDCVRQMSDEELAEWLDAVSKSWYDEGYTKDDESPLMSEYPATANEWIAWLKSPVEEGDNG